MAEDFIFYFLFLFPEGLPSKHQNRYGTQVVNDMDTTIQQFSTLFGYMLTSFLLKVSMMEDIGNSIPSYHLTS